MREGVGVLNPNDVICNIERLERDNISLRRSNAELRAEIGRLLKAMGERRRACDSDHCYTDDPCPTCAWIDGVLKGGG